MQEKILESENGRGRQTEPVLHIDELQFRRFLEKLPAGAYTCDPDGLITYFNQRAVQLWGRAPRLNDPIDRYCGSFKLFSPDGSPIAHDQCWMALAVQQNREYNGHEIVIERPGGRRLTVMAHANPIHDESGRLLGAVNVLVDITERKMAEAERARLAAIVESSDDAIIGKTLEGIVTSWNRGAEKIYGYSPEEVVGRHISILVPPERPDEIPAIMEKLRRGEKIEHFETVRVTRDGRRLNISLAISPIRDSAGNIVAASTVARDITERKRAEAERERILQHEREISRTLQRALLPPSLPEIPGCQLAARYAAAGEGQEVGGDFYDAFSIQRGGWALVVGDVTGKGPEAAALTSLAHYTVRAASSRESSPQKVLEILNEEILRQTDGNRYFTALFGELEPQESGGIHLEMADGGHPPPFVLRSDGRIEFFEPAGMVLGVVREPHIGGWKVDLRPGDAVVLYTDGVTEARNRKGEFFGEERLKELCESCAGLTAEEIATRIETAVVDFQHGNPHDDVALLVLKVAHTANGGE